MHKILVNGKDMSSVCGGLTWSSNIDTLGVQCGFNATYDKSKEYVKDGDIIKIKEGNNTIFTGIVETVGIDGYNPRSITVFDFAYYLNKSDVVIQFKNQTISDAIKTLCKKFGVKTSVVSIQTKIKKIYKDKKVSDVIKDLLDYANKKTNIKYRMEMRNDTLFIEKQSNLVVKLNTDYIINPKRTLSISEMVNSVSVVGNDSESTKILASAKDNKSIAKYGLLQMVEESDVKNKAQALQIANNLLKQFNKIAETGSVELLGNSNARAGRVLQLNEPVTGLKGNYIIKSVSHTSSGGIYTMQLILELM